MTRSAMPYFNHPQTDCTSSSSTHITHTFKTQENLQMNTTNNPWLKNDLTKQVDNAFPVSVFPDVVRDAILEMHQSFHWPLPLIGVTFLGAMAAAAQGLYDVSIAEGRVSPVSLIIIALGESGIGKSPIHKKVMKPFSDFQSRLSEMSQEAIDAYRPLNDAWEAQRKGIQSRISYKTKHEIDCAGDTQEMQEHQQRKPIKPRELQLIAENVTSAALIDLLQENPISAHLTSAEAAEVLKTQAFEELEIFNKLWSGEVIQRNRDQRGSRRKVELSNARLSLVLLMQPKIFGRFIEKSGEEMHDSGFLARSVISLITKDTHTPPHSGFTCNDKLLRFYSAVTELLERTFPKSSLYGKPQPRESLKLSPGALQVWSELETKARNHESPYSYFADHTEYSSKWPDQVARIAALFHVFDGSSGEISVETMRRAIILGEWLADAYVGAFSIAVNDSEEANAELILEWLAERGLSQIKRTYFRQFGPSSLRDIALIKAAIKKLEEAGLVTTFKRNRTNYVEVKHPGSTSALDLI